MTLFGAVWRGVTLFGELVIVPDGSILDFVGFRWICRQREVAPESYYYEAFLGAGRWTAQDWWLTQRGGYA